MFNNRWLVESRSNAIFLVWILISVTGLAYDNPSTAEMSQPTKGFSFDAIKARSLIPFFEEHLHSPAHVILEQLQPVELESIDDLAEAAKRGLEADFPVGTDASEVQSHLEGLGARCWQGAGWGGDGLSDYLVCRYEDVIPIPRSLLQGQTDEQLPENFEFAFGATWIVGVYPDTGPLENIRVKLGLTGP